ncbi:ATPase central domain-containing protein [Cylindrospermum sp. NIES-4074]|nr:ATPase central domain-containing protein [Cylindrospermum sp. NIES-4074]
MKHSAESLIEADEPQEIDDSFYLTMEVMKVRSMLQKSIFIKQAYQDGIAIEEILENFPEIEIELSEYSPLAELSRLFNLSLFEQYVLLLCAAVEIDPLIGELCAEVQGNQLLSFPTIRLALDVIPEETWNAFTPEAPLRRWQLIDIDIQQTQKLIISPLQIDHSILFYLLGKGYIDQKLMGITESIAVDTVGGKPLQPSHQKIAEQLAAVWSDNYDGSTYPLIQFCGGERSVKQSIIASACVLAGFNLSRISIATLSTSPASGSGSSPLNLLKQRWERGAKLTRSILLLDCDEINSADTAQMQALSQLVESLRSPLVITSQQRQFFSGRSLITFDIPQLTPDEQQAEWQFNLGKNAIAFESQIKTLVSQFNLSASAIQTVCLQAFSQASPHAHNGKTQTDLSQILWHLCRLQARPALDHLATRIETQFTWDDLILPPATKQALQQIYHHVQYRQQVYNDWQMVNKQGRGLGINALFYGSSGLGKTTTAEIIAKELHLDLYRIDLSAVVSKYIGETEKNLSQIFDAAESGGVVLLFDEADALFGKRSQVKEAKDRYANMEVSYLLQRMETYRGLSILTTNREDDMDGAFRRRLRFIVEFPFPKVPERIQLWKRAFPPQIPTEGLDMEKLAQLDATGATIRSIALNAAFLAAAAGEPVKMTHMLQATRQEITKLGKSLTARDIEDWV